jgi:pyroglutamyl-peptidase
MMKSTAARATGISSAPLRPLLVTAFGPFGGRRWNASSLALAELRKMAPELRTRILPVDAVEAPRRMHEAIRRIAPRAVVMLGEAGGATRIRLEERAWNEMDFAIPDIAGRQPRGMAIDPAGPAFLDSRTDIGRMLVSLDSAGHAAERSQDPGRYLCNRLYHGVLSRWSCPAIFIHLPLENHLPPARAAAAVHRALGLL